ncbi:MAG: histidine--tRNA ligase [Longimicrobiales bacterium]
MTAFQSLPGFRDFYPEDFAAREQITRAWREAARRYGFEEYDGPPLEPLELYTAKSGAEIVEQLYHFTDKGGREVALRPEMTPTLARMAGARARALAKPLRWFSVPQLFRYERTQRGRLREHLQWNVDIVGETDVAADAEVLAVAIDGLRRLGLSEQDVEARVNDRRLLERLLLGAGVTEQELGGTYAAIDKLGREPEPRVRERLAERQGLHASVIDRVFQIFAASGLEAIGRDYGNTPGVAQELNRLTRFFDHLRDLELDAFVRFDPRIVRGLAYYTGIVFEIFDRAGELRAICGGGRYDQLLAAVAAEDLPAVGFGMGDVVLGELLRERGLLGSDTRGVDFFLVAVGEEQHRAVYQLAGRLRERGYSAIYALRPASVGRQFKDAAARDAARVVVLGPDELAAGLVVLRDMATGEERRVSPEELVS